MANNHSEDRDAYILPPIVNQVYVFKQSCFGDLGGYLVLFVFDVSLYLSCSNEHIFINYFERKYLYLFKPFIILFMFKKICLVNK